LAIGNLNIHFNKKRGYSIFPSHSDPWLRTEPHARLP